MMLARCFGFFEYDTGTYLLFGSKTLHVVMFHFIVLSCICIFHYCFYCKVIWTCCVCVTRILMASTQFCRVHKERGAPT